MSTVAETMSQAAARGLDALTVYSTAEGWQANARYNGSTGWRVKTARTIADAIAAVLTDDTPEEPQPQDIFG